MKKLLCAILALMLLLSFGSVYADEETTTTSINESYKEACGILSTLNIIDVTDSNCETPVTRGEFASIICKMYPAICVTQLSEDKKMLFRDVTDDSEYYNDIISVYSSELMVGKTNRTFGTDESVTVNEASKVIMLLLGYNQYASVKGGYFTGYNRIAADKGLFKGISVSGDNALNKETMAKLILNAMNIDFMTADSIGNESITYASQQGTDILGDIFNVYRKEGQITAIGSTDIFGISSCNDDQIAVDREKYLTADNIAIIYDELGTNGIFYIQKKDELSKETVIYYENDMSDCKKLFFDKENYNDLEDITVLPNAKVVYNSVYSGYYSNFDKTKVTPEFGGVNFVDSDGDRKYDIVIIRDLEYRIVDDINSSLGQILLGLGQNLNQKGTIFSDDENITFYRDSKVIDPSAVGKGNLLEIEVPLHGDDIKINVVNNSVTGYVTAYSEKTVTVKDKEYNSYKDFHYYDEKGNEYNKSPIEISGTFYIDSYNKVCMAVMDSAGEWIYGYLYQASYKSDIDGERIVCKILEKSNMWIETKTTGKSIIDGDKATAIDLKNRVIEWKDGDEYVDRLIKFKLDSDESIKEIDTASTSKLPMGPNESSDSLKKVGELINYKVDHTYGYNFAESINGSKYKILSSTALLKKPSDLVDDDLIQFVPNTAIVSLNYYDFEFYNPDKFHVCDMAIMKTPSGSDNMAESDFAAQWFMITKVSDCVDSNGEQTKKIKGYKIVSNAYSEQEYIINGEALSSGKLYTNPYSPYENTTVKRGLLCRTTFNSKEEVVKMRVYYDCYNQPKNVNGNYLYFLANTGDESERAFGEILDKDASRKLLLLKTNNETYPEKSYQTRIVIVYDSGEDDIRISSVAEADAGNNAYILGAYSHAMVTVIVK